MQFLYDPDASASVLTLEQEAYRHLFKVRRLHVGEIVSLRNLRDDFLYRYRIDTVDRKSARLSLTDKALRPKKPKRFLHLLWCMIDPKTVEKSLPALNQIGVFKITFVYCERSQRHFRPDFGRLEKILINSCQQCGRSDLMEMECLDSLEILLDRYAGFSVLDFGGEKEWGEISSVLVGCEGGFTEKEREMLHNHDKIAFRSDFILKSETAAQSIAAKLLI